MVRFRIVLCRHQIRDKWLSLKKQHEDAEKLYQKTGRMPKTFVVTKIRKLMANAQKFNSHKLQQTLEADRRLNHTSVP